MLEFKHPLQHRYSLNNNSLQLIFIQPWKKSHYDSTKATFSLTYARPSLFKGIFITQPVHVVLRGERELSTRRHKKNMATRMGKKVEIPNVGDSKSNEEMAGTSGEVLFPQPTLARIKNKQRRQELYKKLKQEKKKEKIKARKERQKERELLGDRAPPKQVPHTIESLRLPDETMVDPEDEEVAYDEMNDEMAPYFRRETTPKIVITTREKASRRTRNLAFELQECIPNSEVFKRRPNHAFKKMIQGAIARDFTDIIVINEDRSKPNGLYISHLPEGPTLFFKMNSVRLRKEIPRAGEPTDHKPELILNNFNTRLGHTVSRAMASLFDHDPNFKGRRVVTFHNQRDYIFFRHHRYVFRNARKAGLHELGPRFTLRLRTVQKGTFDSKYGEYEWIHKRKEMDTSRRKFHL